MRDKSREGKSRGLKRGGAQAHQHRNPARENEEDDEDEEDNEDEKAMKMRMRMRPSEETRSGCPLDSQSQLPLRAYRLCQAVALCPTKPSPVSALTSHKYHR